MSQNTQVMLERCDFTRTDYTALRAYCLKIPVQRIAELYYSEDSPAVEHGLERFLIAMRDKLIEQSIERNPRFAEILKGARQGGAITSRALEILIQAADLPQPVPAREQSVSVWFRPLTVRALKHNGILTIGDLVQTINRRGSGWWRSIPRVGPGKAKVIVGWLQKHPHLGEINQEPWTRESPRPSSLVLTPGATGPLPFGSFVLPPELDGSNGSNRSPLPPYISANDDLSAIDCYLSKYTGQHQTHRAYLKELERLVIWCVMCARKPLSSLDATDCKAYLKFLTDPPEVLRGPSAPRTSARWRPFSERPISQNTQKYILQVLRGAFDYLVSSRYLGGNPWVDVRLFSNQEKKEIKQISNAIWCELISEIELRAGAPDKAHDRAALVAILLMGEAGLKPASLCGSMRSDIYRRPRLDTWYIDPPMSHGRQLLPLSARAVSALANHFQDRGLDFYSPPGDVPLLAPLTIPNTKAARERHALQPVGYTGNGLYDLLNACIRRVSKSMRDRGAHEIADELTAISPQRFSAFAAQQTTED